MFNGKKYTNFVGNEKNRLGLTKQNIKSVCCMWQITLLLRTLSTTPEFPKNFLSSS